MKLKKQITTTIVLLIYLFSITPLFAISANNTYYKDENGEIVEQKNYEKTGCRGSSLFLDFGARYLDSKYSRWLSTDPALQSYIPQGNSSQEDKAKEISQLPGMGGIYNTINSHLYHYAGNNPVKYVDPDGEAISIGIAIAFSAAFLASYYSVLPIIKNNIEQTDKNSFDFINGNNLKLAKEKSVSDIGQGLKRNAQSTTSAPAPMQQPDDESDENRIDNKSNQSAKDAKKIDGNKRANDFSQDKGYKDAHDMKKSILKNANARDQNVSHYDIYNNKKTGEIFLKHKNSGLFIPE